MIDAPFRKEANRAHRNMGSWGNFWNVGGIFGLGAIRPKPARLTNRAATGKSAH
jgi:hypothetical protein